MQRPISLPVCLRPGGARRRPLWRGGRASGTPLHVVSEILGHASITITRDIYGHLLERDRRAVAASMSQALFVPEPAAVAPSVAPKGMKHPSPERVGACDLGALGGTRTPNLLIRKLCYAHSLPVHSHVDLPECYSLVRSRWQR